MSANLTDCIINPVEDCIFCKVVKKEIPARIEYEDADIIAFDDIHPSADWHILVVPKEHIGSLRELNQAQVGTLDKIYQVVNQLVDEKNLSQDHYRVVVNGGKSQIIPHLHFHLLGGKWRKFV